MSDKLTSYLETHSSEEPVLLAQLRRETFQKTIQPHMLSGAYQGRLLSMISQLIQPKTILEIGTFTGYSALCLLEGLAEGGKLITLDKNDELEHLSQKYFEKSPRKKELKYILGNALEVIPTLDETFDLVFIDADKVNYQNYFNLVIEKMNPGALILVDNVLWYNKVLDLAEPKDKDTLAIQAFNKAMVGDSRVETVMLPIRDGISLIRVKK